LKAAKLRCLQRLQIGIGPLSHTHAKLIGDIDSLRQIWLQGTNFDDAMLRELARLKRLETLDLMQTDVTGAGLKHLYGSATLTRLWIDRDKISSTDVDQLRTRLPNLEVSY
jgi:internalin A